MAQTQIWLFMDFEYTPEQQAFRLEVRAWLEANLPKDLCVDDAMDERVAPNREVFEKRRKWQATLHRGGWVGLIPMASGHGR